MRNLFRFGKVFGLVLVVIMSLAWLNDIRTAPQTSSLALKARMAAYVINHGAKSAYAKGGVEQVKEFCNSFGTGSVLGMYPTCDITEGGLYSREGNFQTWHLHVMVYQTKHDLEVNRYVENECYIEGGMELGCRYEVFNLRSQPVYGYLEDIDMKPINT